MSAKEDVAALRRQLRRAERDNAALTEQIALRDEQLARAARPRPRAAAAQW
eukprot:gene1635-9104_t